MKAWNYHQICIGRYIGRLCEAAGFARPRIALPVVTAALFSKIGILSVIDSILYVVRLCCAVTTDVKLAAKPEADEKTDTKETEAEQPKCVNGKYLKKTAINALKWCSGVKKDRLRSHS